MEELLTLRGRVPRGPFCAGLIIDDFICLEQVRRRGLGPIQEGKLLTKAQERLQRSNAAYDKVGLVRNTKKSSMNELQSSFWGADIDGDSGLCRASLVKSYL